MDPIRPDPDQLLKDLHDSTSDRGFLKVFLGYAAGVGKSFAMLQAANVALLQGRDVVVGWIEPHDRPETLSLVTGIPQLRPRQVPVGKLVLSELDLDACLKRSPEVLLVDELAHTNAPGSRHKKRWQDIDEMLNAGIEVWTTSNIQHLESMNYVVAKVTKVRVQETVPDRVFDNAKEVEIVDIDPEDLIDRLRQGKIYQQEQAKKALDSFFRKENLLALRELTLRRAAERVGKELDSARNKKKVQEIWPVRERLMVSVGPSPLSEDLLRQASRLARSLGAELLAVTIEVPSRGILDSAAQTQLARNLAVAESLGAETVILKGEEIARDLLAYARSRNVGKLVVGKNRDSRWKAFRKRTIGDELLRLSGDIDVYVLSGRPSVPILSRPKSTNWGIRWRDWVWSLAILITFTVLALIFRSWGMNNVNIVLTVLLSVVFSAAIFGLSASIFTSVMAVLVFNFFFTKPLYSLYVYDPQSYLVFFFMLLIGGVIGTFAQRLRRGIETSRDREQRVETLNRMHRELASQVESEEVRNRAGTIVSEILHGPAWVIQRNAEGDWLGALFTAAADSALFDWAWKNGQRAGKGTGTFYTHRLSVWPLMGSQGALGLLILEGTTTRIEWIESLVSVVTSALERVELIELSRASDRKMETERSRNALLHGLSHDLRTPLTIMAGSLEALEASEESQWSPLDRRLLESVRKETWDLSRQVENLLDLSRLSESELHWSLSQVPIDEPLLSAVDRFRNLHVDARVSLLLPNGSSIAIMEPRLVEQVLSNFFDNALEYGGSSGIEGGVSMAGGYVRYWVSDRGSGVKDADKLSIFEKFHRGSGSKKSGRRGTGLGLAIVREVARIHKGRAWVQDRDVGGSTFVLEFPAGEIS